MTSFVFSLLLGAAVDLIVATDCPSREEVRGDLQDEALQLAGVRELSPGQVEGTLEDAVAGGRRFMNGEIVAKGKGAEAAQGKRRAVAAWCTCMPKVE